MKNNADGGFLDDGSSQDPVSGNEVPTGSLAEEVRDDIPAQLSEGEFVVPADVVRFIGLEKLMKMRDAAKNGLASMEAEGQIGGSSAPMQQDMGLAPEMDEAMEMDALIDGMDSDDFEGVAQNYAHGGSVHLPSYQQYTGRKEATPDIIQQTRYVNAAGDIIVIPTLKGDPLKLVPEGYFLYVEPEDGSNPLPQPIEDGGVAYQQDTTNNQAAQDFAQNGGREERDEKIAVSNQLQRERIKDISSLAGADLSQEGVNRLYESLTPQARAIYDKRFRDPSGPDSFMTKGMSSADMLIAAQKTADSLNNRRGVIEIDNESMYSTDTNTLADIAKTAALIAKGLTLDPLGALTGFLTGSLSDEDESAATKLLTSFGSLFEDSPFKNKDGGVGNQPTTGFKVPTFNQAHWVKRMGELNSTGMSQSEIQRKLFQEQQSIPALFGVTAYGQSIPEDSLNTDIPTSTDILSNKYNEEDKKQRTLDEISRKQAAAKKEEKIQVEIARVEAEEAQKVKDDNDKQEAIDREGRKQSKEKADGIARIAREEAVRKAEEDAATQRLLDDQNRRQQGQSTGNGGDGRGQRQRDAEAGKGFGQGNANKKTEEEGQTDYGFYNYGGLASKIKPTVKKMRKDPTSGLVAKKKSKQKAQAKKGALAAKRT